MSELSAQTPSAAAVPAAPEPATPKSAAPPAAALPPLTGSARAMGTLAVSLATFMNVLDASIANVSIPAISGDLGVSPMQGTWVITSFGVASAISVPLTGWLTQRFGQVRLFVWSVLLFVMSSWLCGLAPNIESLIFFRVLQGLVAGPMMPLSQTLLLSSYPPAMAGTAMALWGLTILVAPVIGPLLGGWITDVISWPWIFYINVPVGLLAAAMAWSVYRFRDSGPRRVPLDRVGLLLLVVWVGSMQIMIDKGKELDWFESTQIVTLTIVAVVGLAFFLAWELTESNPIVDLRLFLRRNFLMGTLAQSLSFGVYFGNLVILPLWLQQWMGYTATWAGMALAPVGLMGFLLSPLVGKLFGRVDSRGLATVAFLGLGLVMYLRSHFTTDIGFNEILWLVLLQGAVMAFYMIPLQHITLGGLPASTLPAAAGLSGFVRTVAGAMGTSIFTTLWDSRATLHHARLVESLNANHPSAQQALQMLSANDAGSEQASAILTRLIDQQAYTAAATDLFYLSSFLMASLVALVWLAKPPKNIGGAEQTAGAH